MAVRVNGIGAQFGLAGAGFDAADKMASFILPSVEVLITLVVAVIAARLTGSHKALGLRALIALAVG